MALGEIFPEQLFTDLGRRLRRARIEHGDRQRDMAARLGVTRQTVGRMERGDPSTAIGLWLRAAELYGLSESWEGVMQAPEDPFDKYDRQHLDEAVLRKKRVRKL